MADTSPKKPMDWKALAAERARAFGLPVDELEREVQRERRRA